MTPPQPLTAPRWTAATLFAGDDDTAAAHRDADWAGTPLGPVESWPSELTAAVATVFDSDVAMLLWWGPELIQIFNHAYAPFLGTKYPTAIGQSAPECWPDVWPDMGPLARKALDGRTSKGTEVRLLMDRRGGLMEETYWTFSYSPVRSADGGALGVFVATSDVTGNVLGERRMTALQRLGSISATRGEHPVSTCRAALTMLSDYRSDLPLLMLYLDPIATFDVDGAHRLGSVDNVVALDDGRTFELVAVGDGMNPDDAHKWIVSGPARAGIAAAAVSGSVQNLEGLSVIGTGPVVESVPVDEIVGLPLRIAGRSEPVGVLAVGTNPLQVVGDQYRWFLDVIASRLSTTLTDVLAFEFQRHRSDALAELDATKTRLLENVSHEFRTPLTMLLAPLKEMSEKAADASGKAAVDIALRNAHRLQRLVDSLLDVARAGSGALSLDAVPTDIAELTRRCLDRFDGAFESAGLKLDAQFELSPSPIVSMDPEKWTRITTNLVANALNYTHEGSIRVALSRSGSNLVLQVSDTGIGLSARDRSKVFDRFYRVQGAHGRSAEGSGIGLALVSELAAALGGTVAVDSEVGVGSTFTVAVPVDDAIAPVWESAVPLESAVVHAHSDGISVHHGTRGDATRSVLLVEDNPDMREYLVGLLTAQNWDVYVAADVETALGHARTTPPSLVLTDVMLPGRSGLDLVREVRSDMALVRLPVVVLTARAGTESAVEGLESGADDYVVKPFAPRELIARIRVHLELSAFREELLAASNNETTTLKEALRTRSTIGTAIGLLMAADNCDADAAFKKLTTFSQHSNRKARDVAAEIVEDFTRR
ncbi:ATP-binding protein [Rhodococcoides kyotonense]|uniref:histidine kinase n=1 Tax=Rhodococcoides kyotonense TaxID=398843 RepID=A0A239MJ60_9NOCA|nr:ATP-binding protein [Rhodococcus kyotonensis]SNT42293.1 Signal transduction histidine kinase [Rhodococcus kyotonensis]